jgi:hypothetical protein
MIAGFGNRQRLIPNPQMIAGFRGTFTLTILRFLGRNLWGPRCTPLNFPGRNLWGPRGILPKTVHASNDAGLVRSHEYSDESSQVYLS